MSWKCHETMQLQISHTLEVYKNGFAIRVLLMFCCLFESPSLFHFFFFFFFFTIHFLLLHVGTTFAKHIWIVLLAMLFLAIYLLISKRRQKKYCRISRTEQHWHGFEFRNENMCCLIRNSNHISKRHSIHYLHVERGWRTVVARKRLENKYNAHIT